MSQEMSYQAKAESHAHGSQHEVSPSARHADTSEPSSFPATERTTFKRLAYRGTHQRDVVYSILDEGFVCHVAFSLEGRPFSIPTAYARQRDRLVLHGSSSNHMLRALIAGAEACVTVTLVDGLVIARSAFHHSINYRSVVLFAKASEITDPGEKMQALHDIVEHLVPGRWAHTREPNRDELTMTKIIALPIKEASAKVRSGPPLDDEADHSSSYWAGVLPLEMASKAPEPCPRLRGEIGVPANVSRYRRPGR